jgi:Domain of unknown function (DUF4907)
MKSFLLLLLLLINHQLMASWRSCEIQELLSDFSSSTTGVDTTKSRNISFTIINGLNNSYGYDIFVDGKLMVHQPSIPAVSGQKGFTKKEDAEKVAQLVVSKIKAGVMPPTVTRQEMEKLGVSLK